MIWAWLVDSWNWPKAALIAGAALLLVLPIFAGYAGLSIALIFVQLPIYLLHQFEEHSADRFRLYVNRVIAHGREALTPVSTFWINAIGVWILDIVAILVAWRLEPRWALFAAYGTTVNGIGHIAMAIRFREYNPGLLTSLVLFLPLGVWCIAHVGAGAGFLAHGVGLAVAIVLHVAILVVVRHHLESHTKREF